MSVAVEEEEQPTSTKQDYMPFIKAEWKLLTNLGTGLKSNFVFSNVLVKFCEVSKRPACK